jgi:hypothetical protein
MKCLEKDRNRRYETSNSLVAELRRHFNHEPVVAGPPSSCYRLRKFARRYGAVLATVALLAAALVVVAVVSVFCAREQARATEKITGQAKDLSKERESLKKSLAQSNRLLAIRDFERGLATFEQKDIGPGMLWMIESWRLAIEAGDPAWQRAARANVAHWRPHYPRLKAVLSHSMSVAPRAAVFSPDSRTVISGSEDGTAQLWDVASGKRIGQALHAGGQLIHVAFSANGKSVLTSSEGNTARLWNTTTCESLGLTPPLPRDVQVVAIGHSSSGPPWESQPAAVHVRWRRSPVPLGREPFRHCACGNIRPELRPRSKRPWIACEAGAG